MQKIKSLLVGLVYRGRAFSTRVYLEKLKLDINWYCFQWLSSIILTLMLVIMQEVYDKDTFSLDDPMGNAEFDIRPFVEAVRMNLQGVPNGTMITKVALGRQNCLADESNIYWSDGKVLQDLVLRLKDVERGEVELQLQWVSIPGASGL